MTIQEKQQEYIDDFSFFSDWEDKYEHIIALGKDLEGLNPELKTDLKLIKGCQSNVWLHAELLEGKLILKADSDAILPKGIAALLIDVFSDQEPQKVVDSSIDFLEEIGLREFLSPTRANGMLAMLKQIKFYAFAFSLKAKS